MKIVFFIFFSLLSLKIWAIDCFEFKTSDFPDNFPITPDLKTETWCYQQLKNLNTFIFAIDNKGISERLGMMVEKNGKISFLDQKLGKLRVIEQSSSIENPYQIPVSVKKLNNPIKVEMAFNEEDYKKITKIKNIFENSKKIKINTAVQKIDDIGDEESYLPEDQIPMDGYWWPFRDIPMANPEDSPTKLYDLYVQTKTGRNPNSTGWEIQNHSLQTVWWGGHCNGWAASTILYGFYDKSLRLNDSVIQPYQIQGMRTEASFCVKFAFFGNRFKNPGDDPRDITPDLFHKTIRYYLKELKKPVALDRINNETVDNSIFSGYRLQVDKESGNRYHVTAFMRTHFYNYSLVNTKKMATTKELRYSYTLNTNAAGEITGGTWDWESPNPDFLWVPISQMNCGRENPNIDPNLIDEMITTLPKETN